MQRIRKRGTMAKALLQGTIPRFHKRLYDANQNEAFAAAYPETQALTDLNTCFPIFENRTCG